MYNESMRYLGRACGVVLVLFALLAVSGGFAAAQVEPSHYSSLTGHNISGDFWVYYQTFADARSVFGEPITEQFPDPVSGRVIQYFQRARFEYFPENPPGQRVKLSSLGVLVSQKAPPGTTVDSFTPIGCRYFSDTGFSLCYAFLRFYDSSGGELVFGKPISDLMFYNGRVVQYFERARFEWYPEYAEGQKVRLAELGRIYFDMAPEDPNRLQPASAENSPSDVRSLNTRLFTWKAVTQLVDQQVIYVVVQDQTLKPVPGATAVVTISWPQGGTQSIAQTTNAAGFVSVPILVQGQPHGSLVILDVEVLYNGFSSKTRTSFRIWE
jgi:hypothetical protein